MTIAEEIQDFVGLFLFMSALYGVLTSNTYSAVLNLAYVAYAVFFVMANATGRGAAMTNRNKMAVLAITFIGFFVATAGTAPAPTFGIFAYGAAESIIILHEFTHPRRSHPPR